MAPKGNITEQKIITADVQFLSVNNTENEWIFILDYVCTLKNSISPSLKYIASAIFVPLEKSYLTNCSLHITPTPC